MAKNILGYKVPFNMYEGRVRKGSIMIKSQRGKSYKIPGTHQSLPKELVENWEPVYEETPKVVKKSRKTQPKITPDKEVAKRKQLVRETEEEEDFSDIEESIWDKFAEDIELEEGETLANSPIRIQGLKKIRTESLHEFLIKFFAKWNEEKDTLWVESKEVQTEAGKKRSLGDIYMICKYYYPDCTLRDVLIELYDQLPNNAFGSNNDSADYSIGFRSCICQQINKRVWWYEEGDGQGFKQPTRNDEYGHTVKWYRDNL